MRKLILKWLNDLHSAPQQMCGEPGPDPRYPGSQSFSHAVTFPSYIPKKGLKTLSSEKHLKLPFKSGSHVVFASRYQGMLIDICLLFRHCTHIKNLAQVHLTDGPDLQQEDCEYSETGVVLHLLFHSLVLFSSFLLSKANEAGELEGN